MQHEWSDGRRLEALALDEENTPMIEIKRILCPTDFSDFSRRALDYAVAIAKWYESTITVLHVCGVVPVPAYAPGSGVLPSAAPTREDREALLTSLKRFAEGESGANVPIEFDIAEGTAWVGILAKADEMPADLLVVGTHGRSGFERLVLGSVTEKVLRRAACPVLTIPQGAPAGVPATSVLFKNVVCAVDFSDCSMHALNYAMALAQEADAHLTVIHVIELPPDVPREVHENMRTGPRSLREYVALAEEDGRARLRDAIPESVRAYCVVDTVLATGKPYREILRVAEEQKADLLVAGIHGRGPVDRLLFGSTAQHLVRRASCPVLTLRQE
jgi:nucleotide-binding universal stress UspA family protein